MQEYKYALEKHPKKKGECPNCRKNGAFRYYEDTVGSRLDIKFGICDRVNNCGYKHSPHNNMAMKQNKLPQQPARDPEMILPNAKLTEKLVSSLENTQSNFHKLCDKLKIPDYHLTNWDVGSDQERTLFIFRNIKNEVVNAKWIKYLPDGKRDKKFNAFSLKQPPEKELKKYSLCLYGEHLLNPDKNKIVCIVESEKTAAIASHFYTHFDWVSCGSANGLTDAKISVLYNRYVYWLADADKTGRSNSSIKKLKSYGIQHDIVDLFSDRDDGYDIADAIIDGTMPVIQPNVSQKDEKKEYSPEITRVEKFINEYYDIRYNVIANRYEFKNKNEIKYEKLNENTIFRNLQKKYIKYSIGNLLSLLKSDFTPHYNPIEHYFNSLPKWDGTDHIDKLTDYIDVIDKNRFKIQFKKMFVRSIACGLGIAFNKHAFILVHNIQNSGKTTLIRWLCPPQLQDYYTENISTDKDSLIALTENFFINLDELSTLSRFEINALKSIMSKDRLKVRIPYERTPDIIQRRCNFIGSTNRTEFLSDETGSVRWIAFLINSINWDYKKDIDIDKVWSQAYYLFKSNEFHYQLTAEEIQENELANAEFQISTPEMEMIPIYYKPGTAEHNDNFYTSTDFVKNLTEKTSHSIKFNNINMGKALAKLKFIKVSNRVADEDYPIKGYYIKFQDKTLAEQLAEKNNNGKKNKLPF